MYYVYHISDNFDLIYGYIGVTNNLKRRWKTHCNSQYTIGKCIRENKWNYDSNMRVVYSGDEKSCFKLEHTLRPEPYMGMNESVGGRGGNIYDSLSESQKQKRNKKISAKLKNREVTWNKKISETRIEKGITVGSKNPNSRSWKLIDGLGNVYFVVGELQKFCDEKMLLRTCLMRYLNTVVPDVNSIRNGGYRPKNMLSKELRYNTTGWSLYRI
jgi:hypothetical protein